MLKIKIGLISVDTHHFPNLPLMKLSAWHKQQGDSVEWYQPLFSGHMDRVYVSKVFSFTPDYEYYIDADEVIKGGSGCCIELVEGKEIYHAERDRRVAPEVENIYPDYSIYPKLKKDNGHGFFGRGWPGGCNFFYVGGNGGREAYKVGDLLEVWDGQKNIVLLDPNTIACPDWRDILQQLIDSGAWVDFSQGVDIRLMTEEKAEMIKRIKIKNIHFAWDRYEDKDKIVPKFKMFSELTGWDRRKMTVYVLTNFDTTIEQDLERIYTLRELGYWPYVMIYDKEHTKSTDTVRKLQRWVNMRAIFESTTRFEDYQKRK